MRTHHTLAGYARAAVDAKTRMAEHCTTAGFGEYVTTLLDTRMSHYDAPGSVPVEAVTETLTRVAATVWKTGEPYVLAPAMTAVVAAAAQALDLTGDILTDQEAPCDRGALFLPDPVYHRVLNGTVSALAAITWAAVTNQETGHRSWLIFGWADRDDPDDPQATRLRATVADHPQARRWLGPYVLTDFAELPVGTPVPGRGDPPQIPEEEQDWETSPEGRNVIDEQDRPVKVCAAIAYAFWRIATQPLATLARPPLDRPTRRRAQRARVVHDTRVVMLRRLMPEPGPEASPPRWHYRVRFVVRGHWRRLVDRHGNPYRIWIHAHIKGPDGAPLLHGEKVAVLAR